MKITQFAFVVALCCAFSTSASAKINVKPAATNFQVSISQKFSLLGFSSDDSSDAAPTAENPEVIDAPKNSDGAKKPKPKPKPGPREDGDGD